ncbi:MAG: hypothetical protein KF851_18230 [Pirellulaceae bacterium]|nr:hypothetical protein [Pirellulaceae bacterium]
MKSTSLAFLLGILSLFSNNLNSCHGQVVSFETPRASSINTNHRDVYFGGNGSIGRIGFSDRKLALPPVLAICLTPGLPELFDIDLKKIDTVYQDVRKLIPEIKNMSVDEYWEKCSELEDDLKSLLTDKQVKQILAQTKAGLLLAHGPAKFAEKVGIRLESRAELDRRFEIVREELKVQLLELQVESLRSLFSLISSEARDELISLLDQGILRFGTIGPLSMGLSELASNSKENLNTAEEDGSDLFGSVYVSRLDNSGRLVFLLRQGWNPIFDLWHLVRMLDPPDPNNPQASVYLNKIWEDLEGFDKEEMSLWEQYNSSGMDFSPVAKDFDKKRREYVERNLHSHFTKEERSLFYRFNWLKAVNNGRLDSALFSDWFDDTFERRPKQSDRKKVVDFAERELERLGVESRRLFSEAVREIFQPEPDDDSFDWLDDLLDTYVPPLELLIFNWNPW